MQVADGFGLDAVARTLDAHASHRGVLWVGRPGNVELLDRLRRLRPDLLAGWHCVYDAEAVFALRVVAERALRGETVSDHQRRRLLRAELRPAELADRIVAVSSAEAAVIREHVGRPVAVLSYPAHPRPTANAWNARRALLFVGAADLPDTPNGDSLVHFLRDVMPDLAARGVRLGVAGRGTAADGWLAAHAGPQVDLLGMVGDLEPLYAAALAFVAPTRYGAGIPIKVLDAARHGLPVIASPFVAAQLGWRDREELLVARDAADWALAAGELARDPVLWQDLRACALAALERDYAPARFAACVGEVAFGDAGT